MKRCVLFLFLMLSGCGQRDTGVPVPTEPESEETRSAESAWLTGKQAYDQLCAGCHEEGLNDAPRTADRDAWEGRSWLWEAVLFEHARRGYKDMPAKGGDATLDEATVTRAAEYMLLLTYPETHRD